MGIHCIRESSQLNFPAVVFLKLLLEKENQCIYLTRGKDLFTPVFNLTLIKIMWRICILWIFKEIWLKVFIFFLTFPPEHLYLSKWSTWWLKSLIVGKMIEAQIKIWISTAYHHVFLKYRSPCILSCLKKSLTKSNICHCKFSCSKESSYIL